MFRGCHRGLPSRYNPNCHFSNLANLAIFSKKTLYVQAAID
jgi:hypothetical protein